MANVDKPYILNGFPYLGADDTRPTNIMLSHHVVTQLLTPYFGGGYNVTLDNFFTSMHVAKACLEKDITILGTIRSNRRELPSNVSQISNAMCLHSTVSFQNQDCLLTLYKCKRNKSVLLLSTYHSKIEYSTGKKKPSTVTDYNASKYGVDVIDQMAKHFSCKVRSRRWPLQTFCNLLDLAAINALTLFQTVTGSKISRRKFLLQLFSELIDFQAELDEAVEIRRPTSLSDVSAVRRQCQMKRCSNKSYHKCSKCTKMTCG